MAEALRKPAPPERAETAEAQEAPRTIPLAPPAEKQSHKDSSTGPEVQKLKRRNWTRWGLFALLPLVLLVGVYWYVTGGRIMSSDDAYVEAEKVGISTDVSGIVKDVDVTENQYVKAGQVLYRLDPEQFQIAVDNAKANLAQTALMLELMKKDYQRMLSDIAAQEAVVEFDRTMFASDSMLLRSHTISQAVFDQAKATLGTTGTNSNRCASRRRCSWPSWAAIRTSTSPSIRNIARPRRKSTRPSGSSTTQSSKRRSPES